MHGLFYKIVFFSKHFLINIFLISALVPRREDSRNYRDVAEAVCGALRTDKIQNF